MSKYKVLLLPFQIIWKSIYFSIRFWPLTLASIFILNYLFPEQGQIIFDFIMPALRKYISGKYVIGFLSILVIVLLISASADEPKWKKMKRKEKHEKFEYEQIEIDRKNAEYIANQNHPRNAGR